MALRICALRALKGATLAGNHVHDSALAPIEDMLGAQPFIIVSSEDEVATITGFNVTGGERSIDIVIEAAIANSVKANTEDQAEIYVMQE